MSCAGAVLLHISSIKIVAYRVEKQNSEEIVLVSLILWKNDKQL